jgi:hypothetical protein
VEAIVLRCEALKYGQLLRWGGHRPEICEGHRDMGGGSRYRP